VYCLVCSELLYLLCFLAHDYLLHVPKTKLCYCFYPALLSFKWNEKIFWSLYQECHFIMLQHQSPESQSICCLLSNCRITLIRQNSSYVYGIHILFWLDLKQRTDMNQNKTYPNTFNKNSYLKISWTLWVFFGGWRGSLTCADSCAQWGSLNATFLICFKHYLKWRSHLDTLGSLCKRLWDTEVLCSWCSLTCTLFCYSILCMVQCCSCKYGHGYTKYCSWAYINLWIST